MSMSIKEICNVELDMTQILIALIPSILGGGGLVMGIINSIKEHKRKKEQRVNERLDVVEAKLACDYKRFGSVEKQIESLAEGTAKTNKTLEQVVDGVMIGLKNDRVLFTALRDHNIISGGNATQEREIDAYYAKCMKESFTDK